MTTESLTYSELGDRLGRSPEAARSLARRLRLVRKPGNDGKVRVIVDLADIQYKPAPTRSPDRPRPDADALNTRIERLPAELAKLETALKPVWPNTGSTSSVSATVVTS